MAACEPFACGGASQFCVRVGGRAVGSAAGKHWANRLVLSRGRGRGRRVTRCHCWDQPETPDRYTLKVILNRLRQNLSRYAQNTNPTTTTKPVLLQRHIVYRD